MRGSVIRSPGLLVTLGCLAMALALMCGPPFRYVTVSRPFSTGGALLEPATGGKGLQSGVGDPELDCALSDSSWASTDFMVSYVLDLGSADHFGALGDLVNFQFWA